MYLCDELNIAYKIGNKEILNFPFPHMFIENIFPTDFYQKIQDNLPSPDLLEVINKKRSVIGYDERFVLTFDNKSLNTLDDKKRVFWTDFRDRISSGNFKNFMLSRFLPYISQRFENINQVKFYDELLLVHDVMNYKLGPHTDAKRKVITFLFYLPKDDLLKDLGTSIYMPKDFNFKCEGGPHHNREDFEKIITMPFLPNSLFCFIKTNNSFHGVEEIKSDEKRWLLLYDIYVDINESQKMNDKLPENDKFSWQ